MWNTLKRLLFAETAAADITTTASIIVTRRGKIGARGQNQGGNREGEDDEGATVLHIEGSGKVERCVRFVFLAGNNCTTTYGRGSRRKHAFCDTISLVCVTAADPDR